MIDWSVAFATASQAVKFAQELRSIGKQLSEADLKLKIAGLTDALASLKITLTEAKDEIADKDKTIERLKSLTKRVASDLVNHKGHLYRKQPDSNEPAGNPFCDVCYQK